ncbi:MAG TPA: AAA family ATPase [Candidatus Glassbacteria bacterium]|nr:AAA family ATPase [Candidatus Glassbacteria bacterium]
MTEELEMPSNMKEVVDLIKANTGIVQTITYDESDFIDDFYNCYAVEATDEDIIVNAEVFVWSAVSGVLPYDDYLKSFNKVEQMQSCKGYWENSQNPAAALKQFANYDSKNELKCVLIMRDFNTVMSQPIPRMLRDIHMRLQHTRKCVLGLATSLTYGAGANQKTGIEPTLEKVLQVCNYALPSFSEIRNTVEGFVQVNKDKYTGKEERKLDYTETEVFQIVRSLQGLTAQEIKQSLKLCLSRDNELNPKALSNQKKQIITKSQILEFIESGSSFNEIGGMENLKEFINDYSNSHSEEAKEFGVEPLKGILLTGVPGTGKSASAKALGNQWGVPTLRLDVGRVMTGLVGGSEEKMRQVLDQAQAISPCVLWIDEIEKSLSGTGSSNFSDGGTLSRVFGTLLTAMEEGLKGVTVVATANDITSLPPELIRRFNEVFFVDLPKAHEREQIFAIHLRKRGRSVDGLDLQKAADATKNYTGSEIEKVIKDSIAKCFRLGKVDLTTDHLIDSAKSTRPIFEMMDKKIEQIRDWAKDRARYASNEQSVTQKQIEATPKKSDKLKKSVKNTNLNLLD